MNIPELSFTISPLHKLALTILEHPTEEAEIRKVNINKEYYQTIQWYIANRTQRLGMNIIGNVRQGKSTVAWAEAAYIHQVLRQTGQIRKEETFSMRNIARNQTELRALINRLENNILVVDEIRQTEDVGRNITADKAILADFFNVNAFKRIHTIVIAPQENLDPTADIQLQVVATDVNKGITHCWVRYRVQKGLDQAWILVGYVNINVMNIIKNWITSVKPVWDDVQHRDEKAWEYIYAQGKQDPYVEYIIKKYQQIEIINKYKVTKTRTLEYSEILLHIINQLKVLTRRRKITKETIKGILKMRLEQAQVLYTELALQLLTDETYGILLNYSEYHRAITQRSGDMNNKKYSESTRTRILAEDLQEIKILKEVIQDQEKELERQSQVYKEITEHLQRWDSDDRHRIPGSTQSTKEKRSKTQKETTRTT